MHADYCETEPDDMNGEGEDRKLHDGWTWADASYSPTPSEACSS